MVVAFRPPRYDEDGRVFVKAYYDVMDLVAQEVITPTQAFLHTVIARAAYEGGGWTNISHEQLAAKLHLKPGMLRAHLKKLDEAKLVESRSRRGEGQAKDYRPLAPSSRATVRILTVAPLVEAAPNRQDSDTQPSGSWRINRQDIDALLKKIPEKTGVDADPVLNPGVPGEAFASPPPTNLPDPVVITTTTATVPTLPDASPSPASGPSAAPKSPARKQPRQVKQLGDLPPEVRAQVEEIWEHYRAHIQPEARVYSPGVIAARLATFSKDEIKDGIDHFAADSWWMDANASQGADWFFKSDGQVDKWRTLKPRQPDSSRQNGGAPQRNGSSVVTGWPGAPVSDDAVAAARVRRGLPQ